jgi:hypothetical protein
MEEENLDSQQPSTAPLTPDSEQYDPNQTGEISSSDQDQEFQGQYQDLLPLCVAMPAPMSDNDAVAAYAKYNGVLGGISYDPRYGDWDLSNSVYASYS